MRFIWFYSTNKQQVMQLFFADYMFCFETPRKMIALFLLI
jgi:hypothetical protein